MTTKTRNTRPRGVIERPPELNEKRLHPDELQKILDKISELHSYDLIQVMNAISKGLVDQRAAAKERSLDMELAVANLAMKKNITRKTWEFILNEYIAHHEKSLRVSSLIEWIQKRSSQPTPSKTVED